MTEYVVSAPTVPVIEYVTPVPVIDFVTPPARVIQHVAPAPVSSICGLAKSQLSTGLVKPQFSTTCEEVSGPEALGSLQYHTGITNWINILWEKSNIPAFYKPVRIHCKAHSVSARLVFETRGKCQDFVARYRDDGILYEIDSPFCNGKTVISVRQSKSLEDREIGKQFAPLWRELADQLKILFPEGDGAGCLHCPCARRPFTCSQHQGSKKRLWKTSVQSCPFWKRTVVCSCCT